LTRYCNGFIPSIKNFNEVISDANDITIIIDKIYCKSGKEERISIKINKDDEDDKFIPIIMLDVVMHLIQHHKHKNHQYFEGLTRYKMTKSGECVKLPDNEYLTTWGN
jgi:hypothetical protein